MTEIYLIRHAQAEGNIYRMMQGHWDGKITEAGREQISVLAERFKDVPVAALYSSDLSRAVETAQAITKYHPLQVITDPRLREMNMGAWEKNFLGNHIHYRPDEVEKFSNDLENWHAEGSESSAQVTARAMAALKDIAEANDGKIVAAVSHGITTRCIISAVLGAGLIRDTGVPNTAVTHIYYENGRFTMDYYNNVDHMAALPAMQWGSNVLLWDAPFDSVRDEAYYKQCYSGAWLFVHGTLDNFSAVPYYKCAVKHSVDDSGSVLRLYCDDKSAGIIDMDPNRGKEEGYGWISLIYLEEEFRYRGIGIQALARAFKLFSDCGRKAIRLHVAEENREAISFYKKWGFKIIAADSGFSGKILLMERKLGENGCF